MPIPACPVVHFELPYRDATRVSTFYQTVFGWQLQPMGPEMGNYILATTSTCDSNAPDALRGSINGACTRGAGVAAAATLGGAGCA
jgi:predicted enzyme related to lactoylglutathione lyase